MPSTRRVSPTNAFWGCTISDGRTVRLPGAFCSLHSGGFGRKLGTLSGTENRRNPCFSSKRLQIIHTQLIISQKCSGILILAKGSPSPMRFLPPKTHSKNPRPMAGDFCQLVEKSFRQAAASFLHMKSAKNLPSINKGRYGFDRQKCPHTASSPLRIRQYSLRVFPCLGSFLLRQNCRAPASHGFSSDFWFLRRRRAGARQGEKDKKRRKDTLAGLSDFVN